MKKKSPGIKKSSKNGRSQYCCFLAQIVGKRWLQEVDMIGGQIQHGGFKLVNQNLI